MVFSSARVSVSTVVALAMVLASSLCVYGQTDFDCVRNSPEILSQCGAELQYSGAVIQFNRTDTPTQAEIQAVKDAFEENKLPTKGCCAVAQAFSEAKCVCDPSVRQLLPVLGFEEVAINAVMGIVQKECGGFEYITDC